MRASAPIIRIEPLLVSASHTSISLSISRTFSNATHRWVEENTTREVGVTPLGEGRLLLEVLLNGRKVLLHERVVVVLVSRPEMLVIQLLVKLSRVLRPAGGRRVLGTHRD